MDLGLVERQQRPAAVQDAAVQPRPLRRLPVDLGQRLVVLAAARRVAQDLVGAADLEEQLGIAGLDVAVGVEPQRRLPVGPAKLVERGAARHAQESIVVPVAAHAAPASRGPTRLLKKPVPTSPPDLSRSSLSGLSPDSA